MSELKDKTKVIVIGAGPNVIGQSGECDEGAVDACRALSAAGHSVIYLNSNPDALLLDPTQIEKIILEPLTLEALRQVIQAESPAAVLAAFAGRDGLHIIAQLSADGKLDDQGIKILGPSAANITRLLDREALKLALSEIGLNTPPIFAVGSIDSAVEKAQQIGFPVVLRCNDHEWLPDGILAFNQDELREKAARLPGDAATSYSVEASLLTWQQVELEILRDSHGKTLIAGCVEYLDSAGIHPGDALAVCPSQGIPDKLLKQFKGHAVAIADHLGIVGNATIRFAYLPEGGEVLTLAVHPRYTRTSAMVARSSGCPLGETAALLAAGLGWQSLSDRHRPADQPSSQDEIVAVKWPDWDFDRLDKTIDRIGPQMQAVGQTIALGGSFKEALQKAARAASRSAEGLSSANFDQLSVDDLLSAMATPSSRRVWLVMEALRKNVTVQDIVDRTQLSIWFLQQLEELIASERRLNEGGNNSPDEDLLRQAKREGFGNSVMARLLGISIQSLEQSLDQFGIRPTWCAQSTHDATRRFSTFNSSHDQKPENGKNRLIIIGSGAHRIGQGPDCDYGVCQAAAAAREQGYTPTILNSNMTSVTTGNASPAATYCEPLTDDDILSVIRHDQPIGVIAQFAGMKAFELSRMLSEAGIPIMGTPIQSLQLLQNRQAMHEHMREIGIPQPTGMPTSTPQELEKAVQTIGFPLLMQSASDISDESALVVRDEDVLRSFIETKQVDPNDPLFVEQFLEFAIEVQAETLSDGSNAYVAAVMEHIELAGVHAGDSACVMPPYSIAPRHIETIEAYCQKIATALEIHGLLNLRFAIYRDTVYLLAASCRATRNLSFIEQTHQFPLAGLATRLMIGQSLEDLPMPQAAASKKVGLRAAVFPFNVYSAEDPLLGPSMRSTGQVLAMADSFGLAYFKAMQAAGTPLPTQGTVLITVTDEDKTSILEPARIFQDLGFSLMATKGTQSALNENGLNAQIVRKLGFGRPDLVDEIKNGRVQMVINTPTGGQGQIDDSLIRQAAIQVGVANITTPASALAAAKGIAAHQGGLISG